MREHNTTHTLPSKLEKKKYGTLQRHTYKMTGKGQNKHTKPHKKMKTIRGAVVTEMKKKKQCHMTALAN
jgi:hypothetical protein